MSGARALSLTLSLSTAGNLVQELIQLLGESRRLTRAALHLLLVPHLQELSLRPCPSLASNAIGQLITMRCKVSGHGPHPPWGFGCPPALRWGWGSGAPTLESGEWA